MTTFERPRVAIIGLDESQVRSISQLCGTPRQADTLEAYLENYSWTETDIVVSSALEATTIAGGVHLLSIGPSSFRWPLDETYGQYNERHVWWRVHSGTPNTEREVTVSDECPDSYRSLADRLVAHLRGAARPPDVVQDSTDFEIFVDRSKLIVTPSSDPVALRLLLSHRERGFGYSHQDFITLVLPQVTDCREWFSAFLTDVHAIDPDRVPHSPPRLSGPSDWFTPQERAIAAAIESTQLEITRLEEERQRLEDELEEEGRKADQAVKQSIWGDGETLVAATSEILRDLGFKVEDMDAEIGPHEAKREDLRLTLPDESRWEAIVEIKGYSKGVKTNDAEKVRRHRDRYSDEKGGTPDITLWLVNEYRLMDPSTRPATNRKVGTDSRLIGAVCVLTTDLYRLWVLVQTGDLKASDVVQELIDAPPGMWKPAALDDNT